MSSLLDRLLGRDRKKEPEKKPPSKVSEEAARKRREELAQKRKASEEAREKAEKDAALRKRTEEVQAARKAAKAKKEAQEAKEAMEKLVQKGKTLTADVAQTYVVKSGDSLSKIAKELLGDASRWPEIYELNKDVIGDNPNLIRPGQEFKIPK
jgi:nucleoid-associated protein YgaU